MSKCDAEARHCIERLSRRASVLAGDGATCSGKGLYAEVARQSDLLDRLQRRHRVVPAGPIAHSTILNSLQMGFRTLAIEKRSSEVWTVLSAVKTGPGKFGDVATAAF